MFAHILLVGLLGLSDAAIKGSPHPHQGILTPFTPGQPSVVVSGDDEAKLDGGEMITKQTKDESGQGGRATAIQAIHAPPEIVWGQLLDLNSYPSKVDKLTEVAEYP